MSEQSSLIQAAAAEDRSDDQSVFLFTSEMPQIDRAKPVYHCTGEILFKTRPDIYGGIITMLAEPGIPLRLICRTMHISPHTLKAVQEREGPAIAESRSVVLRSITRGLHLCAERVEELAPEMSARDALVGVGILAEKMQLLSGAVTARVEVIKAGPNIFERMAALHADLVASVKGRCDRDPT